MRGCLRASRIPAGLIPSQPTRNAPHPCYPIRCTPLYPSRPASLVSEPFNLPGAAGGRLITLKRLAKLSANCNSRTRAGGVSRRAAAASSGCGGVAAGRRMWCVAAGRRLRRFWRIAARAAICGAGQVTNAALRPLSRSESSAAAGRRPRADDYRTRHVISAGGGCRGRPLLQTPSRGDSSCPTARVTCHVLPLGDLRAGCCAAAAVRPGRREIATGEREDEQPASAR